MRLSVAAERDKLWLFRTSHRVTRRVVHMSDICNVGDVQLTAAAKRTYPIVSPPIAVCWKSSLHQSNATATATATGKTPLVAPSSDS